MTGRLLNEPFVAVFPSLIRSLGSMEAAAVLQYIAFRQPADQSPVELRVADIADALALSEGSVKRHTRVLAAMGVLVKHQAGRNAVVAYEVVRGHPLLGGPQGVSTDLSGDQSDPLTPSIGKECQEPPATSAVEPPVVLALVASGDTDQAALFASDEVAKPETWPPEASVAGCQAAWTSSYEAAKGRAHPGVRLPAMAAIKQIAAQCQTLDDYRDLWRASAAAGTAGRFAVRDYLGGPPTSRFARTNAHVAQAEQAANMGMLDDLLTRPAIGGPA